MSKMLRDFTSVIERVMANNTGNYLWIGGSRAQWTAAARVLKAHSHLIACMKQLVKPQVPALTKEKAKRQIKRLEGI